MTYSYIHGMSGTYFGIPAIQTDDFRGLSQSLHVNILYITEIRSRKLSFKSLLLHYPFGPGTGHLKSSTSFM